MRDTMSYRIRSDRLGFDYAWNMPHASVPVNALGSRLLVRHVSRKALLRRCYGNRQHALQYSGILHRL